MRITLYLCLALTALLLASCETVSEPRFEGDAFSVTGLLVSGKPIGLEYPLYVTRSTSIEEFDPMQIFVFDAAVKVTDLTTRREMILQPVLHDFKIKYIDPDSTLIQPGHSYRVEAQVAESDSLIWGQTTVPIQVAVETDLYGTNPPGEGYSLDPDTGNTIQYSQVDTQYPIVLSTGENQGVFNFIAEIYCREEFSTDLEFTNPILGIVHPDESLEPIYNSTGESMRRIRFLGRFNSQTQPGVEGNHIVVRNYSQAIAFYGRYRISAYIADDNYYNYTFMPEGYLHGGIHNGLGYFGSASGGVMYARMVKS